MSTWSPKATVATTTATTTKSLDKDLLELIKFREERKMKAAIFSGLYRVTCGESRAISGDELKGEFYNSK